MRKLSAYLFILFICLATFYLWLFSKQEISILTAQPLRSLSQILALWGIVLMSLTLILSTRLRVLENIFGGLDKVYGVHHLAGIVSFIFLLNHPLLLSIQSFPQVKASLLYLLPSSDLSYSLGVFGIYSMITAFIFMVFIKLPYHLWKWTHKLLGGAFLLGSAHAILITSDISTYIPLRLWVEGFILLGSAALIYMLIYYPLFGRKYVYEVERIERVLDIITIFMRPTTQKKLRFIPGQFVYIKFQNKILGNEAHPFSIASPPQEEILKLSAKIVGDFTLKLPALGRGDKAVITGPYGKFAVAAQMSSSNSLWIAGGIGVTPFLSMLGSQVFSPERGLINFYYTYSRKEEGVFTGEIQNLVQKLYHVRFFDWCSQEKKRLSLQQIKEQIDLSQLDAIFLCGPLPMMESLCKQFIEFGIPQKKIVFENFYFLS